MCSNFGLHPVIYLDATNRNWNKCWQCSKVISDFHQKWWSIITLQFNDILRFLSWNKHCSVQCNATQVNRNTFDDLIESIWTSNKHITNKWEWANKMLVVFSSFSFGFRMHLHHASVICHLFNRLFLLNVGKLILLLFNVVDSRCKTPPIHYIRRKRDENDLV